MDRFDGSVSDRELLEDFARTGSEDSFNVLVQHYKLGLFNTAFRILQDRHAAEDVVQKVFIRLIEHKHELTEIESLQPWLYRTAVNVSLNVKKSVLRRKERETSAGTSPPAESPREAAAKAELREQIDTALTRLKDSLRIPIVLRYLQGMSHAETGEFLNASPDAIRMRIHRALRKLRKLLRGRGLIISIVVVEEGLRTLPAKAASANFLPSASSVIKAASTAGLAAKAAVTTTSVVKGGLIMTAKGKLVIATALLAAGAITYLATKSKDDHPIVHPQKSEVLRPPKRPNTQEHSITSSVPDETPNEEAGLFGYVVDAEGNALAGANVEAGVFEGESPDSLKKKLSVQSTTSDSDGEFQFPWDAFSEARKLLAAGDDDSDDPAKQRHDVVAASKEGYVPARETIDFESATPPSGALVLILRKGPEVSGRVVWKEKQEPIAGVQVICRSENWDVYRSSRAEDRTDEQGNFSLAPSFQGTAEIYASFGSRGHYYHGYSRETQSGRLTVELVQGERITDLLLELQLMSDTLIEGCVIDGEGGPVPRASVRLSGDRAISAATTSEDDGWYRLMVGRDWPYQSYYVKNWDDKPNITGGSVSMGGVRQYYSGFVFPEEDSKRDLEGGGWDWAIYWTPPPHAPPERIVAFHPEYELGITEIHQLGIGQIRKGVDIVLQKGSRVSGKVMDDDSHPVEGARISIKVNLEESPAWTLFDERAIGGAESGEDGSFDVRFLGEGSYELTAYKKEYDRLTKPLVLGPHAVVEGFDFILPKHRDFIRGKALDAGGGPWPHGKVKTYIGEAWGRGYQAEVQEDGNYELSGMRKGKYDLWLDLSEDCPEPEGILWATSLKQIPTGTEGADFVVMEYPAGALRVRVVDETHYPLQKFHMLCCPLSLVHGSSGVATGPMTNYKGSYSYGAYNRDRRYSGVLHCKRDVLSETGEFAAERVAPGSYFVSVKSDDHAEKFAEVKIEAGRLAELTFQLQSLGRIEGIVVDRDGNPMEGLCLQAIKIKGLLSPSERRNMSEQFWAISKYWRRKSPSDGRFAFENLERTDYRVIAKADSGQSVFKDVTIGQDGLAFVTLVFDTGAGLIEGSVRGEGDMPITRVTVVLEGAGHKSLARVDEEGHYAFQDVLAGRYTVKAWTDRSWIEYRAQEVRLREGEHLSVDIVAAGDGAIEGTVTLVGDAAKAQGWRPWGTQDQAYGRRLVLRSVAESGIPATEICLPVGKTFEFNNIPAGTYEVHARLEQRINPEPTPVIAESSFSNRGCTAIFASQPQIVRVTPDSKAAINLTISQPLVPYYPIPDSEKCERRAPVAGYGDRWTDD